MAICAGERIGPYEILTRLGVGGMGEVWKARDTRLNRFVAIKWIEFEALATASTQVARSPHLRGETANTGANANGVGRPLTGTRARLWRSHTMKRQTASGEYRDFAE